MKGPFMLGDMAIFNHDGPDGIAFAVRIDRIDGNEIIINTAAGEYRFLNEGLLPTEAISRPDSFPALKFKTWLIADTAINREFYDVYVVERHLKLLRRLNAIVPEQHFETLRTLIIPAPSDPVKS